MQPNQDSERYGGLRVDLGASHDAVLLSTLQKQNVLGSYLVWEG